MWDSSVMVSVHLYTCTVHCTVHCTVCLDRQQTFLTQWLGWFPSSTEEEPRQGKLSSSWIILPTLSIYHLIIVIPSWSSHYLSLISDNGHLIAWYSRTTMSGVSELSGIIAIHSIPTLTLSDHYSQCSIKSEILNWLNQIITLGPYKSDGWMYLAENQWLYVAWGLLRVHGSISIEFGLG